jgi:Tfp pilus assembly protein PilF
MDSTRVFYLKEQANQSINNRVARYLTRCLRHFYQEEYRDALIEIDKAINLNPNIALAYARRGSIYYKLGDLQRATMNWNIALKLDPEFEEIQELLLASKEDRLQTHSMSK